ncbi:MAG: undecaprenyl-phosphate glucose phosphotransferase [Phycisphaerae bacterium]|nr:undecaprenyl-phosphate glucose phosphotransferase [Phycisphaerae bacterium]
MLRQYRRVFLSLFWLTDLVLVLLAWAGGYGIRVLGASLGWSHHEIPPLKDFTYIIVLTVILSWFVFAWQQAYKPQRTQSLASELIILIRSATMVWVAMYLFLTVVMHVLLSRLLLLGMLGSWIVLLVVQRLTVRSLLRWMRQRGYNQRYAAIVGAGRAGQQLYHSLRKHAWVGIRVAYFIDEAPHWDSLFGIPVYDLAAGLKTTLERHPVDTVFLALPSRDQPLIRRLLNEACSTNAQVAIVPDLPPIRWLQHAVIDLDGLQILTVTDSPMFGWGGVVKRGIDLAGAAAGLILLSPVMLVVAVLVKLTSRGPVLYRQTRCSMDCQPFVLHKFRSMYADAEAQTGPVWSSDRDARVTRVGRFLRRCSLDELPQLWNVLVGDMSLVGPRPERPELIAKFTDMVPRYMLRSHVKAGLTGWAQIRGYRGNTPLRKRVQYDLYYISHWSLALDAWTMLWTLVQCFVPSFFHRVAETDDEMAPPAQPPQATASRRAPSPPAA